MDNHAGSVDADEIDEHAASIVRQCKEESQLSSLETALYLLRNVCDLCPTSHPRWRSSLNNLVLSLVTKFVWTGDGAALGEALLVLNELGSESGGAKRIADVPQVSRCMLPCIAIHC